MADLESGAEMPAGRSAVSGGVNTLEERFRLVADFTYDWEYWIDPEGRTVYVSPSVERITGYPPARFVDDPGFLAQLIHPDDREPVQQHRRKAHTSQAPDSIDFRITTAGGEERWIGHVCQPVYGADGTWLGWRGSNRDITDRKRTEQALLRERDFSTSVLATVANLVVVLDVEGRIVRFNRACERATGYSAAEVQGQLFWELFLVPEQAEQARAMFGGRTFDRMPAEYENEWRTKDGRRRLIAWSSTALPAADGTVEYIVGTGVDITERREAEIKLQQALAESERLLKSLEKSEQRFRSIVETASDAIVLGDGRGKIIGWNRAAERIFGYPAAQILGKPLTTLMPARFRSAHRAGIGRVMTRGVSRYAGETVETIGVRRGGSEFPFEMSLATWKAGDELFFTAILRDVTERQQAEEALREANQSLSALIHASPLAIVALDPQQQVRLWNPSAERIFGWSESETLGHPYPLVPEDRHGEFDEFFDSTLRGQLLSGHETVRAAKNGTRVDVSIWTALLHGREGSATGVLAILADITTRKQAEQALRRYAQEQAALYSITAAAAATLDPDVLAGQVLDAVLPVLQADAGWIILPGPVPDDPPVIVASRGLAEALRAAELSIPVHDCPMYGHLFSPQGYENEPGLVTDCPRLAEKVATQAHLESHVCVPLSAGTDVLGVLKMGWVARRVESEGETALLVTIGRQVGMALHNAHLYQAARQVDHLRTLAALDRALAATLEPERITEVTLQHLAASLDAAMGAVLLPAISPDVQTLARVLTMGRGWADVTTAHPDAAHWEALFVLVAECPEPVLFPAARGLPSHIQRELVARWGSGGMVAPMYSEEVLLAVLVLAGRPADRPFTDDDRALAAVAARNAGQAIANARLYDELRRLLRQQEQTRAQLIQSEKVAALGRLTASIAHEINNPLQAVKGCLTLVSEELDAEQRRDKLDRYLGAVEGEIDRIAGIVQRMRDYYRPAVEQFEPTNARAVLDDVLRLAGKQLQHADIAVECLAADNLPLIQANAGHLKQVFLNLVLNALDAMPSGGKLTAIMALDEMRLTDRAPARPALRIEFRDTGQGIPPEAQEHLFEPFFTTKEGGAGLGLYVTATIIDAHKGHIRASSEPGSGTTFHLLLPVNQP